MPQSNYPSLLEDPHDKELLKYYTTGQLALIDVKTKTVKKIGAAGDDPAVDASPDGQYFRVTLHGRSRSRTSCRCRASARSRSCGTRPAR